MVLYVDLTFGLNEDLKKKKTIKVCNALIMTLLDLEVSVLVSFFVV